MLQIYTGSGKGKTTAAIGQGIRAAGAGLKVIMVQFLKGGESSELKILKEIDGFSVYRFEKERDFVWNLDQKEKEELKKEINKAVDFLEKVLSNHHCDLLIIDEIMGVLTNNFLSVMDILKLLDKNKGDIEIVLTGRDAPKELIHRADLVTEMKEVKHYFNKGTYSRKGIEF